MPFFSFCRRHSCENITKSHLMILKEASNANQSVANPLAPSGATRLRKRKPSLLHEIIIAALIRSMSHSLTKKNFINQYRVHMACGLGSFWPYMITSASLHGSMLQSCTTLKLGLAWGSNWILHGTQSAPCMGLKLDPAWDSIWAPHRTQWASCIGLDLNNKV